MSKIQTMIILAIVSFAFSSTFLNQNIDNANTIPSMSNGDSNSDDIINVKCFFVKKFDVYSFEKNQKKTEDYTTLLPSDMVVYYNFCQNTVTKCPNDTTGATIIKKKLDGSECIRLAGSIDGSKDLIDQLISDKNEWKTYDEDGKKGLILALSVGDMCQPLTLEKYEVTYKIECDENMAKDGLELNFKELEEDKCTFLVKGKSKSACPMVNYYIISAFFESTYIYAGAVMSLVGLVLAIFGAKCVKPTMILVCGIFVALIAFLIVFNIFTVSEIKYVWITLGVGLILGFIIGCLLIKAVKVFFFILGAGCGYIVGQVISSSIIQWITWNPEVLYWIIIIGCALILGLLGLWILKHIMIISTSIIGAYLMVRGVSLYCGGFPDESQIIDLIKRKEWEALDHYKTNIVYIYLAAIVILAGCAILTQEKWNQDKNNDDYLLM